MFHRAVDLGPDERALLLDAECGADLTLRQEVERLLRGDVAGGDSVSRLEARERPLLVDPMLGRTVGVYRLTARIAAGGMGVVYRAERSDGLFEQEVAIKLIRTERASDWMLRRFAFERRTLAGLQHPGIARLYDGGTTPEGLPYFVMEFVRGERIDLYCQRERLPLAARLRLFVQVCRAVHFAHQNLVVHCDLKPANILVDERGVPRLLDFGIARLLEDQPAPNAAAAAPTIARVLTPEYASPEQLAGSALTTSVDVYSLGVVLYELLTGRPPFQSESRSAAEWERLIREQVPERPSTRARSMDQSRDPGVLAASFRTTPAGLSHSQRGDIDRIVLMALRKEPERRYGTAQDLADDIERHLAGQAVRARADSLAYRGWKFVRRNAVTVGASVAVLVALLMGLQAARRSEQVAQAEALHARMEADSFQSIADFLMDAFLPVQPAQDGAWQERARQRILAQAERVQRQYESSDHVRANLLDALGHVCLRLDIFDDALHLMADARAIRERVFGARSLEYALSLRSLGQAAFEEADYAQAAQLLGEALAIHRAHPRSTHADVSALANDLAACLRNMGREAEAEALHLEALALRRAQGARSLPVAESLNNLAGVHQARGDDKRALEELAEALDIRSAILGEAHALTLQTISNLASMQWRLGERELARECMRRAERGYRALGGDGEDGLGVVLANVAAMQQAEMDYAGARLSLEEALALQVKRSGADHPVVAVTLAKLAVLHHACKREDEARGAWLEALRIRRAADSQPLELATALYGFGVFLTDVGEHEQGARLVEESIELHRTQNLGDPLALGRAEYALGLCLKRLGQGDAARDHFLEAVRLIDGNPRAMPGEVARVRSHLEPQPIPSK